MKTSSLALCALLCLSACGANALRDQARATIVTTAALDVAGEQVDRARARRLDAVEEEAEGRPDRDELLRAAAAEWEPLGAAFDAARDALLSWVEALEVARRAGVEDLVFEIFVPFVLRLVLLYDDIVRLAGALDVSLPELPGFVRALAAAPEGR